jgi:DnaK suppressor protein
LTTLCASKIKAFESLLLRSQKAVLKKLGKQLHCSDDPRELALVNHQEEVDDRSLADALNDTDIAVVGHELAELRRINAALLRIRNGTYGICTDCGEPIPSERLGAYPAAQSCLSCRESFEKNHGAYGAVPDHLDKE